MSKRSASIIDSTAFRPGRLVPALLFILVVALSLLGAWQKADRSIYDLLLKAKVVKTPLAMSPRIIPVDLNDRAERNLGGNVDNRNAFADLLSVLAEGRLAGGMDFLFAGERDPSIDARMVDAASRMDGLVLAVVPVSAELTNFSGRGLDEEDAAILRAHLWHPRVIGMGRIPVASTFLLPNRALAQEARFLGHIGVTPDDDGLYRKVPLLYRWEDGFIPSLPLALAVLQLRIDPASIEIRPGKEILLPDGSDRGIRIPIDERGSALIPYPSTWAEGWNRIPLDKVVAAARDEDAMTEIIDGLSGGIVVAADITTSHKDFGTTPIETVYPLSGIHTSILNGILLDTFFRPTGIGLKFAIVAILLVAVFFASGLKSESRFHAAFAAMLIAITVLVGILWFRSMIVPWFATPAIGVAVAWLSAYSIRLFHAREERLLLENALSRYFPRALAARVMSEKRVDLKPSCKELSILFSDISGFTKWSSDKAPDVVHSFLGDYLSAMASIVFEHGGTVDKFIGDGMLAFFGDPYDQPDHAERCLRAALAMQAKAAELREKWQPLVSIDLRIRIGVNTGSVIVGNLGSRNRIEYTVIGAPVNLASRMESNAPVGGILAAKATVDKAGRNFRFGEPQAIAVKGYAEPVEARVLVGENPAEP